MLCSGGNEAKSTCKQSLPSTISIVAHLLNMIVYALLAGLESLAKTKPAIIVCIIMPARESVEIQSDEVNTNHRE